MTSPERTEYLDGFQYEIESSGGRPGAPIPKFVPTAEGYYNFENNKYIYNYTDHLGNVRASYFKGATSPELLEENNYYPFGLKHEGYNPTAGNPSYQYKYQGQELQETGFYSFKWRNYMPDVGRFFNIDPLTEEYEDYTPYQFSSNQPVHAKEIEGLESANDLNKRFQFDPPKRDGALSVARSVSAWGSYTGIRSAQVRQNYINKVSQLVKTDVTGRIEAKMSARTQTPALTRAIIEAERPSSVEKAKTSGTANKTNSSYNSKAEVYGKAGKGLLVLGVATSAYNISTSDNPEKQALKEGASWGGAIAGGETGATIGALGGPVTAAVGGVVGSVIGGVIAPAVITDPCANCVIPNQNQPVLDGGLKAIRDQQQIRKIEVNNP